MNELLAKLEQKKEILNELFEKYFKDERTIIELNKEISKYEEELITKNSNVKILKIKYNKIIEIIIASSIAWMIGILGLPFILKEMEPILYLIFPIIFLPEFSLAVAHGIRQDKFSKLNNEIYNLEIKKTNLQNKLTKLEKQHARDNINLDEYREIIENVASCLLDNLLIIPEENAVSLSDINEYQDAISEDYTRSRKLLDEIK